MNLDALLASDSLDAEGYAYSDVEGARSDDGITEIRTKYIERVPTRYVRHDVRGTKPAALSPLRPPAPPREAFKLGKSLRELLRQEDESKLVDIYVRLGKKLKTSLRGPTASTMASLADAERAEAKRSERVAARKAEAAELQAPVKELLEAQGAISMSAHWLVSGISATVPLSAIDALGAHPDVVGIEALNEGSQDITWTGVDMKASAGLNMGVYHDNGYHGQQYSNVVGGRPIRLGLVDFEGFNVNHRGFLDSPNTATRIQAYYDCGTSCTLGGEPPSGAHGTKVAGIAGGSIRQGQITGFTATERLERTGIAEEPEIYLFSIDGPIGFVSAIEEAIALGIDVFGSSADPGAGSSACDGIVAQDAQNAVYEAQFDGMVVFQSAGNNGGSSNCEVTGNSESVSAFIVGAAADGSASTWSTRNISGFSERGGGTPVIDGTSYGGELSLISAVVPGCVKYYYTHNDNYGVGLSGACNTSSAQPQIAGAAVLVKDWFLTNGYTMISIEGRLLTVMLAMTDRANSASTYKSTGFDSKWGGGRFQARMFDSELGGPYGWETWSGIVSDGQTSDHVMFGSGAEPAGIGQFKVVGMFFEDDYDDMADLDFFIYGGNCEGSLLASDMSRDVKMMARLGSSASSQQLCVRRQGYHVPAGETRRLHHFAYYSGNTSMR